MKTLLSITAAVLLLASCGKKEANMHVTQMCSQHKGCEVVDRIIKIEDNGYKVGSTHQFRTLGVTFHGTIIK